MCVWVPAVPVSSGVTCALHIAAFVSRAVVSAPGMALHVMKTMKKKAAKRPKSLKKCVQLGPSKSFRVSVQELHPHLSKVFPSMHV